MIITLSAEPGAALSSPNGAGICASETWLEEMSELYLLAFMLTADKETAAECVLDAMDDYLNSSVGNLIDWVGSDGKRAVIVHAVRLVGPKVKALHSWSLPDGTRPSIAPNYQPFAVITTLNAFERFVYVLTILEGYGEEECASVLQCLQAEVVAASKLSDQLFGLSDLEEASPGRLDPLLLADAAIHSRCGIC